MPNALAWQVATVASVRQETPHARTLVLNVPDWPGHRAGQHVDVRLVAEDGYQAQRSYSIASAPEDGTVSLTIERLEDGEVSPYLCDVLVPGDGLEVRGPIGGYFVWEKSTGGPLVLIGGGSGVVPLMAMLRHHERAMADGVAVRLLYSSRTWDDVIYRDELAHQAKRSGVDVRWTLTRATPADWTGYRRRIDREMLDEVAGPPSAKPRIFVCGPTPLVESVANTLVDLGHEPARIRTERFGPTG
jgi:ferredoxin-NADP reductase